MSDLAYQYLPILLFLAVGIVFALIFVGAPIVVSKLAGTSKPETIKLSEYESGFPAFSDSRGQFDVRFYLVAILFIVFDLEAAFLCPWAVSLYWGGVEAWWAMIEFLGELTIGLIFAWKVGALEWE